MEERDDLIIYNPWLEDWPELKSMIHVCQGPPRCDLQDDDALRAQKKGCIWCKRILLFSDGSEEIVEPFGDAVVEKLS